MKLCDIDFFIEDYAWLLEILHADMRANVISLGKNINSRSSFYSELTLSQKRLAKLMARDAEIRNKLALIQLQLLPHIEIINKVISNFRDILQKEIHFSNIAGFIGIAFELEIQS